MNDENNINNNKEIVGDVDQQYVPLNNYPAQVYTFSPYYFYSGYIYNADLNNTLKIQITPGYHSKLNPIIIPPNMALKIKNMSIQKIDIAQGYYTFSFIGSLYVDGEPPQFDFDNFTIKTSQPVKTWITGGGTYNEQDLYLGSVLQSLGYNIVNLKEKISFSLHVNSIASGASLIVYIYGVDPQENILKNAPLASSNTITSAPADEIINVDLYGFNDPNYIYIKILINGSNPTADFDLCLLA